MLQRWSFHVDHVDIWFRSRVDCPLHLVGIFRHESSFILVMAASIWFSLGKAVLESIIFEPLSEAEPESKTAVAEIMLAEPSSRRNPVWRQIQRIKILCWRDCIHSGSTGTSCRSGWRWDGRGRSLGKKSGAEWNRPLWWILWGTPSQEFLDGVDSQKRRNKWSLIMKNNTWI